MIKDDNVYLRHILDAMNQIEEYVAGFDYDSFAQAQARLVQDGVIRQLEIIGEATKNLSPTLQESHRDIPWKDIAGMQDKLIHHFGVDLTAVWETVVQDLSPLKTDIVRLLSHQAE